MSIVTLGSISVLPRMCSKPDQMRQFLPLRADMGVHRVDELAESLVEFLLFRRRAAHAVFIGADMEIRRVENRNHLVEQLLQPLDRSADW